MLKKLIPLVITVVSTGCSVNKSLNSDPQSLKDYLAEKINDKKLAKEPLLIIDGYPYESKNLKGKEYNFSLDEIESIDILEKNGVAMNVYGEKAKDGVLLVTTNRFERKFLNQVLSGKTIFLLDGIKINLKQLVELDIEKMKSILIIKEKNEIINYTTEDYDSVVLIRSNK
ncbi:MAG: hypothetical protein KI790_10025 [Cyclobacteriaceae bacterium]|nr:hypothetical protein [Cyclobacteriaceae bacterium HetDA_MAG_MS6]